MIELTTNTSTAAIRIGSQSDVIGMTMGYLAGRE
jgi:hypothetical protein